VNPIEKGLRFLVSFSNILLTLTYACVWKRHEIAAWLGLESGVSFHTAAGTISVLVALFAYVSLTFYFIGTGRWIKDQADAWLTRDRPRAMRLWKIYQDANKLKFPSLPLASFGMIFGVFSFILGGAHQVGAVAWWVHPLLATLLLVNGLFTQRVAMRGIRRNLEYLDLTSKEMDS
jgi:hypothetical protein